MNANDNRTPKRGDNIEVGNEFVGDKSTMHGIDTSLYLSVDIYVSAVNALKAFNLAALSWLARKTNDDLKDQIIGNFIARGTVCLDGSVCFCMMALARMLPSLLRRAAWTLKSS